MTRRHLATVRMLDEPERARSWCGSTRAAQRMEATTRSRREELAQSGWTLRNLCDAARLEEARALYLSLGLEVHLEAPSEEDFDAACAECVASCPSQRFVYTRRAGGER